MGRSDTPDCLGSTAPSATNAARFFSFNCLRRLAVSSARWTAFCNSFAGTAEKYSVFFTHSGRYPNKMYDYPSDTLSGIKFPVRSGLQIINRFSPNLLPEKNSFELPLQTGAA